LTSQQSARCWRIIRSSIRPYTSGRRGRKGAAKQVLKVACGSAPSPFSVPATRAV
jgi:hypothetical protein